MPAQTGTRRTAYYSELDTAPPLRQQLIDGSGDPLVLTGCRVFITIAYRRWSFYYSPTKKIVDDLEISVEAGVDGWTNYNPAVGHLTPAGEFLYRYRILYADLTVQHIPPHSWLPMHISSPTGGTPEGSVIAPPVPVGGAYPGGYEGGY